MTQAQKPHSRAGSRVFSHSLGSPALETIGMGLELCDQPECTNGDHLVGFLRHHVGSLEEQLQSVETTLAHAEAFIEHQDMSYRWAEWCEGRDPNPATEPRDG